MAIINYPKFQVVDSNGDPVTGAKLYTYEQGTTTGKTAYSDPSMATPHANPIVLDSLGENVIYGSGYYKLVLKDSDDTEIWTIDEYLAGSEVDWVSISDYDDSLNTAVLDIGATPTTLLIDKAVTISQNVTVPATLHLLVLNINGGALQPANGITVTYNCPITAGAYRIFGGSGTHTKTGIVGPTLGKWTSGGSDDWDIPGDITAAGGVKVTDQSRVLMPRGHIAGLALSNDTDTDHDILVAVGECKDAGNTRNLVLGTAIAKQIDATWAAGDDAGGMNDGETVGNTTWYHVFLISDGTTVDMGFDTSLTAANLLADAAVVAAGHTLYRRIGSVLTDGSANILAFIQRTNEFLWKDPPLDYSANTVGTSKVDVPLSVPLGVNVKAIINIQEDFAGDSKVYVHSPDVNDEAPAAGVAPLANLYGPSYGGDNDVSFAQLEVWTDTSKQISFRYSANGDIDIVTLGWMDDRGQSD